MTPSQLSYHSPEVWPYLPWLDGDGNLDEEEVSYIPRIQPLLPRWPEEVLREWLFRHWNQMDDYSFLDFTTLSFERKSIRLDEVPGREAFADPIFCDDFARTFPRRLLNKHDWLPRYMLEHGTWNTPIILFDNVQELTGTELKPLQAPRHLLEGHRRLSFLQALRIIGRAREEHEIWLARKD